MELSLPHSPHSFSRPLPFPRSPPTRTTIPVLLLCSISLSSSLSLSHRTIINRYIHAACYTPVKTLNSSYLCTYVENPPASDRDVPSMQIHDRTKPILLHPPRVTITHEPCPPKKIERLGTLVFPPYWTYMVRASCHLLLFFFFSRTRYKIFLTPIAQEKKLGLFFRLYREIIVGFLSFVGFSSENGNQLIPAPPSPARFGGPVGCSTTTTRQPTDARTSNVDRATAPTDCVNSPS